MPSITLTIALLACAALGVLSIARPKIYRKFSAGVVIAGALPTGYALGVLIARTVIHQNWRLFQEDLLFFSVFFALLLGWTSRRLASEKSAVLPVPVVSPPPAPLEPPASRSRDDASVEELQEKLRVLEEKRRQKREHLGAQKDWLAGVEENYQDLMGRFQNASSDDERSSALETLGKVTEDRERARSEVRSTEQWLERLEQEVRTVKAILNRQNRPR